VLIELLLIGAFSVLILGVAAARVVLKAEAEAMKQLSLDDRERRKRLVARRSAAEVTQETRAPDDRLGCIGG